MTDSTPGWHPDPSGRHQHRYWDGSAWTDNVADGGVTSVDPAVASPGSPEPTTPIPPIEATGEVPPVAPDLGAPPPVPGAEPTLTMPAAAVGAPPPPVPDGGGGSTNRRNLLIGGGVVVAAAAIALGLLLVMGDDDGGATADRPDTSEDVAQPDDSEEPNESDEPDEPSTGGEGEYGSDPALDALWDDCEDGDYAACDQLYMESPSGSAYEAFGDTCGERNPPSGFCETLYSGDGPTDGGGPLEGLGDLGDIEDAEDATEFLAEFYETNLGLSSEQATCLAETLVSEQGNLTEAPSATEVFDYLEECDISLSDISGMGG